MARLPLAEQHEYLTRRFSRRSLVRGGLVLAGAGIAAPLVWPAPDAGPGIAAPLGSPVPDRGPGIAAPLGSRAPACGRGSRFLTDSTELGQHVVPFGRHLAFGADPSSQMRINWQTPLPVRRPFLRIGLHPMELGGKLHADLRTLTTPTARGPVHQQYLHAGVDHLAPSTTYYYGVGHDGFDPATGTAMTSVSSFRTGPLRGQRGHYTFTAFGDHGATYNSLATSTMLLGQSPRFHLHAGDVAYADSHGYGVREDRYDARIWDLYFGQIELAARQVPWMLAMGNHELEALYSADGYAAQRKRWSLPDDGPARCTTAYSFVYGNVAFISLDANDVSAEITAVHGFSRGNQTTWLAERLATLRARRDVDFIVVFFHHCAFSTATSHASDGGVRKAWVPLFDRHQVDLVINGHNHVYERTDPIRYGRPTRAAHVGDHIRPAAAGTTYVTAGAAGKSLYHSAATDSYAGHQHRVDSVPSFVTVAPGDRIKEDVTWSRIRYAGYSFLAIDVDPGKDGIAALTVRAVAEAGEEIDRVVLERHVK